MTGLTTHVLDLTRGKPANALEISFYSMQSDRKELIANFVTNSDGRLNKPIFDQSNIREGWYEMVFHAGKYLVAKYKMKETELFFDNISICFQIYDLKHNYHVPLLLSKFGYSTYRGS
ncbi:hydroxyisourate hydrolase [Paracoccaceae bacterium]|nr:hydroxyisourate hydrolase [Paracoccaceae bacterium]